MIDNGVGIYDLPVLQRPEGGDPPVQSPTLDFSNDQNSQYIILIFGGFA